MKTILLTHAARYPLMEPRDAVKLIYQNEFGGGHLIRDARKCLEFLRAEYESISQDPAGALLEDIGNGLCRANLAALDAHGISPEELGAVFIRSAGMHRGSMASFLEKLELLSDRQHGGSAEYFVTNNTEAFDSVAKVFLGEEARVKSILKDIGD